MTNATESYSCRWGFCVVLVAVFFAEPQLFSSFLSPNLTCVRHVCESRRLSRPAQRLSSGCFITPVGARGSILWLDCIEVVVVRSMVGAPKMKLLPAHQIGQPSKCVGAKLFLPDLFSVLRSRVFTEAGAEKCRSWRTAWARSSASTSWPTSPRIHREAPAPSPPAAAPQTALRLSARPVAEEKEKEVEEGAPWIRVAAARREGGVRTARGA